MTAILELDAQWGSLKTVTLAAKDLFPYRRMNLGQKRAAKDRLRRLLRKSTGIQTSAIPPNDVQLIWNHLPKEDTLGRRLDLREAFDGGSYFTVIKII